MTKDQIKAEKSLVAALNKCARVGLSGGVYDGEFCIWPSEFDPGAARNRGDYDDFFEAVHENGSVLSTNMHLDGGAGN